MTAKQLVAVPSLVRAQKGELVAHQRQLDWTAALHQLAASELAQTYIWAAHQGIERLESLERKVEEAERSGALSAETVAELHRCVVKHRTKLIDLADQAGVTIAGILSR